MSESQHRAAGIGSSANKADFEIRGLYYHLSRVKVAIERRVLVHYYQVTVPTKQSLMGQGEEAYI